MARLGTYLYVAFKTPAVGRTSVPPAARSRPGLKLRGRDRGTRSPPVSRDRVTGAEERGEVCVNKPSLFCGSVSDCLFPVTYPTLPLPADAHALGQGSPNFLNKGPVYCPSDFRGAGRWPLGVENVPASVGKNNAPSFDAVGVTCPTPAPPTVRNTH